MPPDRESAPQGHHNPGSASNQHHHHIGDQLRRRRGASYRLPVLDSCHSNPWWCELPSERGYAQAAEHLLNCGLTPAPNLAALRSMWKAGGASRRAAQVIAERWELAA
jgi:hypothetical protein